MYEYSERESINRLLNAMDTVAEDEGDVIVSSLAEVLNVSEVNADNCDEFKLSKGEGIYKIFIMGLPVKIMVGEGNIFPAVL